MNAIHRDLILKRWNVIQQDFIPELRNDVGPLKPRLEKLIHNLEWVRIEEFTAASCCSVGRPGHERAWMVRARHGW
jgi:hypothetical protein